MVVIYYRRSSSPSLVKLYENYSMSDDIFTGSEFYKLTKDSVL